MSNLGFVQAFARYGATLKNPQWSVCAQASDGSLVVSLWQHHIHPDGDGLFCRDSLTRWSGAGRNELKESLAAAFKSNQSISIVIASTPTPELVEAGGDASKIKKSFNVREDLVGSVDEFDGETFVIRIERRSTQKKKGDSSKSA
jgi:hypothetical protein